jgi:hypothetical protein
VRPLTLLGATGGGAVPLVTQLRVALIVIGPTHKVHTVLVPPGRLKPFTDREPGVILTDQFCPVDNLMAEVFRNRERR